MNELIRAGLYRRNLACHQQVSQFTPNSPLGRRIMRYQRQLTAHLLLLKFMTEGYTGHRITCVQLLLLQHLANGTHSKNYALDALHALLSCVLQQMLAHRHTHAAQCCSVLLSTLLVSPTKYESMCVFMCMYVYFFIYTHIYFLQHFL